MHILSWTFWVLVCLLHRRTLVLLFLLHLQFHCFDHILHTFQLKKKKEKWRWKLKKHMFSVKQNKTFENFNVKMFNLITTHTTKFSTFLSDITNCYDMLSHNWNWIIIQKIKLNRNSKIISCYLMKQIPAGDKKDLWNVALPSPLHFCFLRDN